MVLDSFNLAGKTALVTGCSRGIGKAMAEALAEAGAEIIGVSATLQPGSDVEVAVTKLGKTFAAYQCDFSDRNAVKTFLAEVNEKHPTIDILINNAGTIRRAPAAEHNDELWDEVIEVNLNSQFVIAREIGKKMVEQGSGGITVPGYAASKGAIGQLIMGLSNEWASSGVCVNGIAPGYIATDNTEALRNDPTRSRQILERIPAGRWGEPEDFKGPAVFLSSAASNYVTGTVLVTDGGWMGR